VFVFFYCHAFVQTASLRIPFFSWSASWIPAHSSRFGSDLKPLLNSLILISICLIFHSFKHQIFIGLQLCARCSFKYWGCSSEQNKLLPLWSLYTGSGEKPVVNEQFIKMYSVSPYKCIYMKYKTRKN
jgi:hypothetical protein